VTRQAIVVSLVKAALDTEQIAGGTPRPAELDTGTEFYHCIVERLTQLFHACVLGLETLCVRFQPFIDVGNAKVDKMGEVLPKVRDPFRVANLLSGCGSVPGVTQD
jgi:hypothetical protein